LEGLKIETGLLLHKMQTYISQKAKDMGENRKSSCSFSPEAERP